MHTTHFISNGPTQTAFYDLPAEEDRGNLPFVLVHGFTGSKLDFVNQIGWFNQFHRVIAYDQRGHGESSNRGPYSLYSLASDLIEFLSAHDIAKCHILGHSLGGMVVMRALMADSSRFQSAILMDTSAYAPALFSDEIRQKLNQMVDAHGCIALLNGMRDQPQNEVVNRAISYLGENEHWRRIEVKLRQMDSAAFIELGGVLNDHPSVLENLATIYTPTTVIVGEQDKAFLKPSKDISRTMPNAKLATIELAGHSPQYENHELWRSVVENHLTQNSL